MTVWHEAIPILHVQPHEVARGWESVDDDDKIVATPLNQLLLLLSDALHHEVFQVVLGFFVLKFSQLNKAKLKHPDSIFERGWVQFPIFLELEKLPIDVRFDVVSESYLEFVISHHCILSLHFLVALGSILDFLIWVIYSFGVLFIRKQRKCIYWIHISLLALVS